LPFKLAVNQVEISPWRLDCFQDGTLDQCIHLGITPLAWSPMARGLLGGDVEDNGSPESNRLRALLECMDSFAEREGVDRLAIALAFLLVHPAGIIPIIGTQQLDRIRTSVKALDVKLTRQDWYAIFAASQGAPMP
jgi:predicted oxidoreductase